MIQSKLILLFQTLNSIERRAFKKWLRSPLHNPSTDVVQLFDFLMSKKKITAVSVQKKRAWSFVFAGQAYQDAKMRLLMHEALESLKQFVGVFSILSEEIERKFAISREMLARGQEGIAQKLVEELAPLLSQSEIQSDLHFARQFQREALQFELSGTHQRTADNNLPQLFHSSAAHFMLNTLRYACVALSHSNVSSNQYEIPLLDAILEHIQQTEGEQAAAILIYYYTYLSISRQDSSFFSQLKQIFFQQRSVLPFPQQQEILLMAINFCIKQVNTGGKVFAREAFELYQEGLETRILFEKGVLSRFNFKNIVSIGLILKEFEWVESFIETHTASLAAPFRKRYQNFNLAKLRFAQGEYRQAKLLLTQVEYDDVFFTLSAKMMLLKMHYEEGEQNALEALLDNFSRYLQRKSVIGYHKEVYRNIISLVRKLSKLPPGDAQAVQTLRQEILETQPLAERDWLLAQLGEMG